MQTALNDIFEFARLGRKAQGDEPIMRFERLVADLPDQPATVVQWQVHGLCNAQDQLFLDVQASAEPTMLCQRCLKPVVVPVSVANRVQVVSSENQLDDASDDPELPERILGSNRFDLLGLVEDELILALPYVPRHEVCPEPVAVTEQEMEAARPSQFAVLSQLKKD